MPIQRPPGTIPVFIGAGNIKAIRYGNRSLSRLANEAACFICTRE